MTAERFIDGAPVRILYAGAPAVATFLRDPIDHVRIWSESRGRLESRYMRAVDAQAWIERQTLNPNTEAPMMRTTLLAAMLAAASLPIAMPAIAQDALTIYAPDATYTYAGEVLGLDAAAGTYGAAGFVQFDTFGIAPVVDGPRRFRDDWTLGGWTLETEAQATVAQCRLWDIDYLSASGVHVYLRCALGPPQ